jgi:hypothetical protein
MSTFDSLAFVPPNATSYSELELFIAQTLPNPIKEYVYGRLGEPYQCFMFNKVYSVQIHRDRIVQYIREYNEPLSPT